MRTGTFTLAICMLLLPAPALAGAGGDPGSSPADTTMVLLGEERDEGPLLAFHPWGLNIYAPVLAGIRVEGVSGFPVDAKGNEFDTDPAGNFQLRMGVQFDTGKVILPFQIGAEYEHDVVTGGVGGHTDLEGEGYPNHHGVEQQLRKASLRASLARFVHVQGGFMTSQWGMGLVANDGAHGWAPGNAHFADPRGGDRVLRLMLASGPLTPLGVVLAVGHDWVQHDDNMLEGDAARQLFGSFIVGRGRPTSVGMYGVYRTQEADNGALTEVAVVDITARTSHAISARATLTVESEVAVVVGDTTLSPSKSYEKNSVLQVAAALRTSIDAGHLGGVLDLLFTSGDADPDDGRQNAFKPDPNYEMSLFLHRYVLSGMTARATHTAADPALVGKPAADLDRFPTRKSISDAIVIFPRAWWRPLPGLEVYGGPLFALTPTPLADPLNTRLAGGEARNALNGDPGPYLGTELNVGARFRMLLYGTELTLGVEGGAFFAGSALVDASGETMRPVYGARGLLGYRL